MYFRFYARQEVIKERRCARFYPAGPSGIQIRKDANCLIPGNLGKVRGFGALSPKRIVLCKAPFFQRGNFIGKKIRKKDQLIIVPVPEFVFAVAIPNNCIYTIRSLLLRNVSRNRSSKIG